MIALVHALLFTFVRYIDAVVHKSAVATPVFEVSCCKGLRDPMCMMAMSLWLSQHGAIVVD